MTKAKRLLMAFATLVLVLSMLSTPAFAEEENDIQVGQTVTVEVDEPWELALFRFVPEYTATYIFRAYSRSDTFGMLMDSEQQLLATSDDIHGYDFEIRAELQAGQVYYWGAQYDDIGSFSVTLDVVHTYSMTVLTPGTCTEEGLVEYRCSVCGHSYTCVTPPVHDWADGKCTVCGLELVDQGQCGDDVYWYLTAEGCLILEGSGATWDFLGYNTHIASVWYSEPGELEPAPWHESYQQITSIQISPRITHLGENLFWSLCEVGELVLPEGLVSLGESSLDYCAGLETLYVSSTVDKYKDWQGPRLDNLNAIVFAGAPLTEPDTSFLSPMPDGLLIFYHSSVQGWADAMEYWNVPENARWIDMDQAVAPEDLAFEQAEYTITVGQSIPLATNADPYVDWLLESWTCPQEDTALLTGRMITGFRPGTATVTAVSADGSYRAECTIHVVEGDHPDPDHWVLADHGLCGDQVVWCLMEDGTLILSGTGSTWDFEPYDTHVANAFRDYEDREPAPWHESYQEITSIELSPEITHLGAYIFWSLTGVRELELPEGLVSLGSGALNCLTGMEHLSVSSTVEHMGEYGADSWSSIQTITFAGDAPVWSGVSDAPTGFVILYHSSRSGWTEAMENWYLPEDVEWFDLDSAIAPEDLAFDRNAYTIAAGQSIRLTTNADPYVKRLLTQYACSQENVVLLSGMTVTGLRPGTVTITLASEDGRYRVSCTITVTDAAIPDSGRWSLQGQTGDNAGWNDYRVWSSVSSSFLMEAPDGTLERIQSGVKDQLLLTRFDREGNLISHQVLPLELPIFGGAFSGETFNFLLYGQDNPEESDEAEVLRIVRYTKDWQRLDHCSIHGANTTIPFDAGSASFTETNGKLFLHTCHEMYTTGDGLNHQSNMTFMIDVESLSITHIGGTYCSHSFNQLVRSEDGNIYVADHGDAYPRAVYVKKLKLDEDGNCNSTYGHTVLAIQGQIGANGTGVSIGGMELSPAHYLLAGNSVDHSTPESYASGGPRNIFLSVADRDMTGSELIWLTAYTQEQESTVRTPQLVKIAEDIFLILWEEYDDYTELGTRVMLLDGTGNALSPAITIECRLSDCQPIVTSDGMVTWFAAGEDWAELYRLNWYQLLTDPDGVVQALGHPYIAQVTAPTCTTGGYTTYTCSRCGHSYIADEIEALGHEYVNGICCRCHEIDPDAIPDCPFTDVSTDQWYFVPVLWAVDEGITSGTSATAFSPNQTCTRAQVVTFLWRAMGQPEPEHDNNPFTDVKQDDYFYNAVLWAVENGITAGMSPTTFAPDSPCTRGQVVTFLWRAMGEPAPGKADNPFADVSEDQWYCDPVLWAVERGITAGMSPTSFAPGNPCTRAQVVTFLFRASCP